MKRLRRRARALALIVLAAAICGAAAGATQAAFSARTENAGNAVSAAPDWMPPRASRSVVQKNEGGETGFLRLLGGFRLYAQVDDSGNPPSGTASVRATVSSSGYSLDLAPGAWTADGQTYNWSAPGTVPSLTPVGSYPYELLLTDNLGQSATDGLFPITIDNTAPAAIDVQTTNGGATAGRPDAGDTLTTFYSEPIDRVSVVPGWTGGTTAVTVRILNGTGGTNDRLVIDGSSFGTVDLGRNNYVSAETTFTGSTLARNANELVVTLGALGSGGPSGGGGDGTMVLTPDTAAFDRAGNRVQGTNTSENGANDRDF